ncbi:DgyrCDS9494 [Dimorphilus gyrociliatus]|uniref:non-specific serine/threonine protein kinase n=1 Tax=Dimorphilus gyrociliatus TaxID=2664684 RepID=A0A7I8VXH4_9ANNE|nr:DgyrCDS9494 [Dimorphilus gyrociliatus]
MDASEGPAPPTTDKLEAEGIESAKEDSNQEKEIVPEEANKPSKEDSNQKKEIVPEEANKPSEEDSNQKKETVPEEANKPSEEDEGANTQQSVEEKESNKPTEEGENVILATPEEAVKKDKTKSKGIKQHGVLKTRITPQKFSTLPSKQPEEFAAAEITDSLLTNPVIFSSSKVCIHAILSENPHNLLRTTSLLRMSFTTVNVTNLSTINDLFFYYALPNDEESQANTKLTELKLHGCSSLTDWAIYWIVKNNSKMLIANIHLSNCEKLASWTLFELSSIMRSPSTWSKNKYLNLDAVAIPSREMLKFTVNMRSLDPYVDPLELVTIKSETKRYDLTASHKKRSVREKKIVIVHFRSMYEGPFEERKWPRFDLKHYLLKSEIKFQDFDSFRSFEIDSAIYYECSEEFLPLISTDKCLIIVPICKNFDQNRIIDACSNIVEYMITKKLLPRHFPLINFWEVLEKSNIPTAVLVEEQVKENSDAELSDDSSNEEELQIDRNAPKKVNSISEKLKGRREEMQNVIRRITLDHLANMDFKDQRNLHNYLALSEVLSQNELYSYSNLQPQLINFQKDLSSSKSLSTVISNLAVNLTSSRGYLKTTCPNVESLRDKLAKMTKTKSEFISLDEIVKTIPVDSFGQDAPAINSRRIIRRDILDFRFQYNEIALDNTYSTDIAMAMYRFPYFKAVQFLDKIGLILLVKSLFYEDYHIVCRQWLSKVLETLKANSKPCQDDLKGEYYFLTKDTPICTNMTKAFAESSHLLTRKEINLNKNIFCQLGLVLDLSPNCCVLSNDLPEPEAAYENCKNLKEATSVILNYHICSQLYTDELHRLLLYLVTSVYKIGHPFGYLVQLRKGRIVLHDGPVETCISFEGNSDVEVICSTLDFPEAPSLIAGFLFEIATIIEFAFYRSSIYYKRTLDSPWGSELNYDDEKNLSFFNNFKVFYTSFKDVREENSLRTHLIWKMCKELNPSSMDDIYFTDEENSKFTLRTMNINPNKDYKIKKYFCKTLMDPLFFHTFKIRPITVKHSILLISEMNTVQFLFDTVNHGYEISWKNNRERIQRKMYYAELSFLKIQLLYKHHPKNHFHVNSDEIEMKISLDNVVTDCIDVPKDYYQLIIQTREDLAANSDIDFTFAPKINYELAPNKIAVGQKFQVMAEKEDKSIKATIATICDICYDKKELKISHCWLKEQFKWVDLKSLSLLILKEYCKNIFIDTTDRELDWEEFIKCMAFEQIPKEVIKKLSEPDINKRFTELVAQPYSENKNLARDFIEKKGRLSRSIKDLITVAQYPIGFLMRNELRDTCLPFLSDIIKSKTLIPYAFCYESEDNNHRTKHIIKSAGQTQEYSPQMENLSFIVFSNWKFEDHEMRDCTCEMAQLLFYFSFLIIKCLSTTKKIDKSEESPSEKWRKCFSYFSNERKYIKIGERKIICNFHHSLNQKVVDIPKEELTTFVNSSITALKLHGIDIEDIPQELISLAPTISHLEVTECSALKAFPMIICAFKRLTYLNLSSLPINSLPDELAELNNLEVLIISYNVFSIFPLVIFRLSNLITLKFNAFGYMPDRINKSILTDDVRQLAHQHWKHLNKFNLDNNALEELIKETALQNSNSWTTEEMELFCSGLYSKLPRISNLKFNMCKDNTICQSLTVLELQYQSFQVLDSSIKYLVSLKILDLSNNFVLEEVSAEICHLPIEILRLKNCPALKTPPREIVVKGLKFIQGYMRRLLQGSTQCRRTKLMLVGLGGAGKTSLINRMMKEKSDDDRHDTINTTVTDGITIKKWLVQSVEYSIWDFAGQTVYYNTHQFFLSNRAVYFLLWNCRLGHEHAGLEFWLSSIECHAPKAPIFVVGSHIDEVEKAELTIHHLQRRYPQIKGFHYVSSKTGQGVNTLVDNMVEVTLQQQYMNEKIPKIWLDFENKIIEYRVFTSLLSLEEVIGFGAMFGFNDKFETFQAIRLLHELGTLQHFENEFLKDKVVINPQWIVDVMACVISVHDNAVKNGKLLHCDLNKVWPTNIYPSELHYWLIRLTEEFDLSFPLKSGSANLIPCLLPSIDTETFWEGDTLGEQEVQTKMIYNFDYLPSGLFNRAQVRLHQYSDELKLWKDGSLLRKNIHRGFIKKTDKSTVLVEVRGPRPENILFMVHEVFENLIAESFVGVKYDYHVPCSECVRHGLSEPSMLPSTRIRRALDFKIPFMQCYDNFHTLSLNQLQNMLPPENNEDFDSQLQSSLRDLKKMKSSIKNNLAILYCLEDYKTTAESGDIVTPEMIQENLEDTEVSVSSYNEESENQVEETIMSLKQSDTIMVFMTHKFVCNETCKQLFLYAKKQFDAKIRLVLIDNNENWKKDPDIGILCSDAVVIFIDLNQFFTISSCIFRFMLI